MITEFTDRHPTLSAVLIVLLYTVVPGAFMLIVQQMPEIGENSAKIAFVYALVLQVILLFKVDRPILAMLPFILALIGFIVSEIVYTLSMSIAPIGAGPSPLAFLFSSVLVILFGIVAIASVGGLLAYGVIVVVKKVWEIVVDR